MAQVRVEPIDSGIMLWSSQPLPATLPAEVRVQGPDVVPTVIQTGGAARVWVPLVLLRTPATVRVGGERVTVEGRVSGRIRVEPDVFANASVRRAIEGRYVRIRRLLSLVIMAALFLFALTMPGKWKWIGLVVVVLFSVVSSTALLLTRPPTRDQIVSVDGRSLRVITAIQKAQVELPQGTAIVPSLDHVFEAVAWRVDVSGAGRLVVQLPPRSAIVIE